MAKGFAGEIDWGGVSGDVFQRDPWTKAGQYQRGPTTGPCAPDDPRTGPWLSPRSLAREFDFHSRARYAGANQPQSE